MLVKTPSKQALTAAVKNAEAKAAQAKAAGLRQVEINWLRTVFQLRARLEA